MVVRRLSRPWRQTTVVVASLASFGCTAANPAAPTSLPSHQEAAVPAIQITVEGQTFDAELSDNPTARDLAAQLPLDLTFRDFHRVEKVAALPRPLTMDGVPAGDDPEPNDIGYYAPSNNLVLYYGDVGYWDGIVRLGRMSVEDMAVIQRQPDGFRVTIAPARP